MSAARVLIINSFDGGEMYTDYLRHHRFQVRLCRRPEQAVEQFHAGRPDVVVTDMVFTNSDIDGATVIRRLRQVNPTIPIIVLSGYVREEDRQVAREAGADRYLMKPCLPQALLTEVKIAIDSHRRGGRLEWNLPKRNADRRRGERRKHERRKSSSSG